MNEWIIRETSYPGDTDHEVSVSGVKREIVSDLVQCADCMYWGGFPASTAIPHFRWCHMYGGKITTTADDYCSKGERNERSD